ncbi:MAG TPA: HlyD family type I secretion periplasmic adaptor subunit [Azospirillum sp.]
MKGAGGPGKARAPRRSAAAADFQPDAIAIEERPVPGGARSVLYVIVAMFVCAMAWAALAEVDRIVVARGRIVTTKPLIVAQPLETGIIRTLDVSIGEAVREGDRLATLDPTFAEADATALEERLASLTAEAERLRSELDRTPYEADPVKDRIRGLQVQVRRQREAEMRARIAAFNTEVARLTSSLEASREAQAGLRHRLRVLLDIQAMREELIRRNAGSQLQLKEAQLNVMTAQEALAVRVAEEQELRHKLALSQHQRDTYVSEWEREISERLVAAKREINTLEQQLAKAQRRSSLVELRAPANGVVLDVAQRSVGSVAREAEPLITLVPLNVPLEVEAEIGATDISQIRIGDPVRVKLDALPFQKHGTLDGAVRVVSGDTFKRDDGKGESVFRSRIELGAIALRQAPPDFRLIPGMTVMAEIIVGRRSVLSYLIYPVLRVFDESLREP